MARVSLRHNVTIYDAAYVALAENLGRKLYTADEVLVKKFPKRVIHIKDFKL
jgi:predicted nucleic acid-binding protein